jgi:DNA-binding CsgD family transcriptional regulator
MTYYTTSGPMGLTGRQQETLDVILAQEGNAKRAAGILGISQSTLEAHLRAARKRMQAPTRLWLFVLWDRQRRAA